MKHHTKTKGDLGVGRVIADLLSKDIQIALPISEHLPYDLIAIFPNGTLKKVSVKYRSSNEGRIQIPFTSNGWNTSEGLYTKKLDKKEVDFFAVFCPDTEEVYYFDHNDFGETEVTLKITSPKNNQIKGVNMAKDFLDPYNCL